MAILSKGHTFADGDQVTSTKLNNLVDAATFAAGAVDASTITLHASGYLQVGTIQTGNIAANAITTAKIADSTGASDGITTAKLATGAVTTAKITDSAVTAVKIADSSVTTAKIADANITPAKLTGAQTGTAPIYGVRAWAKFVGQGSNGACTVTASGNVTSVTRISSGVYEVVMTTALPDANYCILVSSLSYSNRIVTGFTETTTTFRVEFRDAANSTENPVEAHVLVLR